MKKYTFTISAKDATKAAMKSIKAGLKSVRKGINSTEVKVAALAGIGGLGALINSSLEVGKSALIMSDNVNASVKELTSWQYAGEKVNIEADKMADIFKDIQDKIGDFAITGGGGAADMFEKLNLDIKEFVGLSAPDQLLKIGQALEQVGTKSEKIFYLEALAGDASRLLPLLENNGEELRRLQAEAEEFGVSFNELDARRLEEANRAIERTGDLIKGVGIKITKQLAPYIVAASNEFVGMAKDATKGNEWIMDSIESVGSGIGVMADGIRGVNVLWEGAKVAGLGFGAAVTGAVNLVLKHVAHMGNMMKESYFGVMIPILEAANKLGAIGDDTLDHFKDLDENFQFMAPESVGEAYDSLVSKIKESRTKLDELMLAEMPSTTIENKLAKIKADAESAGAVIEERVVRSLSTETEEQNGPTAQEQKEIDRINRKLERIQQANLTELELLQTKEEEELLILQQSLDQKQISYGEWLEQKYKTEQRYEAKRVKLKQKANQNEGKSLDQLNALKSAFGKKGEKIAQISNLKETAANTQSGAVAAYKALAGIPIIGPALGAAAAAKVIAFGLKAQSGISSFSIGGGDTGSVSISGDSGASSFNEPTQDLTQYGSTQEQTKSVFVLQVMGDVNSNHAETLFDDFGEMMENTDKVLFKPDSRQAQEILAGI